MSSIFDNAPRARATVVNKGTTTDALTEVPTNTIFVEFVDTLGKPSRGSDDYSLSKRCSLEIGDEVEIAYLPYGEKFEELTNPLINVVTGILKTILKPFGLSKLIDNTLEENKRFEHYRVEIIDLERYLDS